MQRVSHRRVYPLLGVALALGAPAGLLPVRMIQHHARFEFETIVSELNSDWVTYAYLGISTALMFALLGFILGGAQDRMRSLMMTDPLTGLFNRRYLHQRLLDELARVARYGGTLSLLMIDVDRLKQINDRLGHEAGDRALRNVADAIHDSLRATDSAARYGGDEFVVLCPATNASESLALAQRIRATLDDMAAETHTTISAGVADLGEARATTPRELFEAADRALYEAKAAGRNSVRIAHTDASCGTMRPELVASSKGTAS